MPRICSFYGIVIAMYYRDRDELLKNWDLAEQGEVLETIAPLA